jgi:ABC-type polar amino acid transport system ATPase subunit
MDEVRIVEISPPSTFFEQPATERAQRFLDKFLYLPRQAEPKL